MPLTTNQRNTVRTAITTWAATNAPAYPDATARTAYANALIARADAYRTEALATGTGLWHYLDTLRALIAQMGLSAAVLTALDNHVQGL